MDGFPSGQRGQTVNLLAMPSKVRILLHPFDEYNSSVVASGYAKAPKADRAFTMELHRNGAIRRHH